MSPLRSLPTRAALAPIMAPPPPPPRSSPAGGSPGAWGPEPDRAAPVDPEGLNEAPMEEEASLDEEETEESTEDGDDGEGEGDSEGEDVEEGEGDDDSYDEDQDEEELGAEPGPMIHQQHVHQAMCLLNAAHRHPGARRRVHQIAALANMGDPNAMKAITALKVAKQIKAAAPKAALALPALTSAKPQTALIKANTTTPASGGGLATLRRWLDVFASWRQGIG